MEEGRQGSGIGGDRRDAQRAWGMKRNMQQCGAGDSEGQEPLESLRHQRRDRLPGPNEEAIT